MKENAMKIELKDINKIYRPVMLNTMKFPKLHEYVHDKLNKKLIARSLMSQVTLQPQDYKNIKNEIKTLIASTRGTVTMKMLLVYADGEEHHFNEMSKALNIPEGNDGDCWKSLVDRRMIAFSSKHERGTKYYRITEFGKFIISIIEANDVFFKPIRWFKEGDNDVYKKMAEADLSNNECAFDDITEESCFKLVEALLDPTSKIHQIGSAYKFMNIFMRVLKTSKEFYGYINNDKVNAWLENYESTNPYIEAFFPKWKKIQKKWMKAS